MRVLPAAVSLAVIVTAASAEFTPARGQEYLPLGGGGPSFLVEVTKPFVSADGVFAGAAFATSAWDASVAYPLASGPALFARMGILYASIEGQDASLALSSARVGALIGSATGNRRAELHVDLPVATDFGATYATGIGIYSNYEEHERFLADTWSVGATGTAQFEPGPDAFMGASAGGTLQIPTDGSTDAYARFSLYGDAPTDRTRFRIEFSSLYLITGEDLDFSDRSTFFASLDVTWPSTRFSPTLFVRAPVDNTLDATVPIVAGLRLSFGG